MQAVPEKEHIVRIRFRRTLEDLLAFSDFYCRESPTVKGVVARYRVKGTLFIALLPCALIHVLAPEVPLPFLFFSSIAAAVVFATQAASIVRHRTRESLLKLYTEDKKPFVEKEVEVELMETGLIARSNHMETKVAWGALERIDTTPDYTFLYFNSMSAFIIPHNRILEGSFPALLAEIGRRYHPDQNLERTSA